MEYRTMHPQELVAWSEHCGGVFTSDTSAYFLGHYQMDPDADPSLVFVAMDGDTIASTVRVFRRRIWLRGRVYTMGGIGEVSTKVAYRRQGLAAELLQMSIAAMEAHEMPVSILFGNQRIYEKAGWRFCPIKRTLLDIAALPEAMPAGMSLRAFAPDDLPFVMGVYDLYEGRMNGAIVRDETYWRQWVLPQWQEAYIWAIDGQSVGYCCVEKDKAAPLLYIAEMALTPQGEDSLPAMLAAVATAKECTAIRINNALLPYTMPGAQETAPGSMMVRLNLPVEGVYDSDALVGLMQGNAGMCWVDSF